MFWAGFNLYSNHENGTDEKLYASQSIGLRQYLGYKLQVDYLKGTMSNPAEILYDVIGYVFSSDAKLDDGAKLVFGGQNFMATCIKQKKRTKIRQNQKSLDEKNEIIPI